jgi:hypothetical protein
MLLITHRRDRPDREDETGFLFRVLHDDERRDLRHVVLVVHHPLQVGGADGLGVWPDHRRQTVCTEITMNSRTNRSTMAPEVLGFFMMRGGARVRCRPGTRRRSRRVPSRSARSDWATAPSAPARFSSRVSSSDAFAPGVVAAGVAVPAGGGAVPACPARSPAGAGVPACAGGSVAGVGAGADLSVGAGVAAGSCAAGDA